MLRAEGGSLSDWCTRNIFTFSRISAVFNRPNTCTPLVMSRNILKMRNPNCLELASGVSGTCWDILGSGRVWRDDLAGDPCPPDARIVSPVFPVNRAFTRLQTTSFAPSITSFAINIPVSVSFRCIYSPTLALVVFISFASNAPETIEINDISPSEQLTSALESEFNNAMRRDGETSREQHRIIRKVGG